MQSQNSVTPFSILSRRRRTGTRIVYSESKTSTSRAEKLAACWGSLLRTPTPQRLQGCDRRPRAGRPARPSPSPQTLTSRPCSLILAPFRLFSAGTEDVRGDRTPARQPATAQPGAGSAPGTANPGRKWRMRKAKARPRESGRSHKQAVGRTQALSVVRLYCHMASSCPRWGQIVAEAAKAQVLRGSCPPQEKHGT